MTLSLSPLHFVERHGLLIIIALGESIMSLGAGARGLPITPPLLGYVALGVLLVAHLWWSYFGPDNRRVERRMVQASASERLPLAANLGLTHLVMLLGILFVAAALEVGVHHPLQPAPPATAWNLAVGVVLYCLGNVLFRRSMGLGPGRLRTALGLGVLLTVPLGLSLSVLWQLLACVVLISGVIAFEDYVLEPRRAQA